MKPKTLNMREFAERLVALKTTRIERSEVKGPAAFLVCEKLRQHLATLMGHAGYRALLQRALALANAEDPRLHAIRIRADGSFEGLDAAEGEGVPADVADGGIVLLAKLLGLLVAFIGENLTVTMMCEIWPKLSVKNSGPGKGDKK